MTIFCSICRKSFDGGKNTIYGGGTSLSVVKCDSCDKRYLVITDNAAPGGTRLLGLTVTKSYVVSKEKPAKPEPSRILRPSQQRLIVTPAEAAAMMRRHNR